MIGEYAALAAALLTTGAVLGVIAVIALGIRREDAAFSLTAPTSDRVARAARVPNGVYTRGLARHASHSRQDTETLPLGGLQGQEERTR